MVRAQSGFSSREEVLAKVFDVLDHNSDGKVDKNEFTRALTKFIVSDGTASIAHAYPPMLAGDPVPPTTAK